MVDSWSVDRRALLALSACVAAQLLFVLAFDPFPGEDTATHLVSAKGLSDFVAGSSITASRVLEWNFVPVPNLLPELVLAAVMRVIGPHWAERLIVLGYVALLPFAAVWAIRQVRPGATPLAFLVLALTFNVPFLWGFLNFSYSIVGFLVVGGLLLRWQGQLDSRRTALLAFALVLVFFTHLVGYLEAGLLAACMLCAASLASERRSIAFMRAIAALAPAAVLTLIFLVSTHSAPAVVSFDPLGKLKDLLLLTGSIATYDRFEKLPCAAAALAVWGLVLLALVRSRGRWIARPIPAGVAAFVLLSSFVALFAPDEIRTGGTLGSIRYMLFPVLGAILWLACQKLPSRALFAACTVAVGAAATLAAIRYDELRAIEAAVQDLDSLEACLAAGSTVVQANLRRVHFGSLGRFSQLAAEAGRLTVVRESFNLGTVDWAVPFGLLKFRKETNPYTHLVQPGHRYFSVEAAPPPFDLENFEHSTGVPLDYVLVFGRSLPQGSTETPPWNMSAEQITFARNRFDASLKDRYTLVRTLPRGIWALWANRASARDVRTPSCQG